MTTRLNAAIWAAVLLLTSTAAFATTLDNVKKRGFVQCGVGKEDTPGFSSVDANGNWKGIDADICRAVAAAVFGDPAKIKYRQLLAEERFTALRFGTIDMLLDKSTWTMQRDTNYDISFAGVTYYDGQGFMARKKLGVSSALELSGASVCSQSGAGREKGAAQFFRSRKLPFEPILFDDAQSATAAYDAGQCDVLTDDVSRLYATRLNLAKPDDHMVLPEIVSKEPLGPFVRRDDDQWFSLVKWTLFALINAEELGVSSDNVDAMKGSGNPDVLRLLGQDGNFGRGLGLGGAWAYRVIKEVGNYGEIFERNLGSQSALKTARGLNALWSNGGILYAPPIR